MSVKEYGYEYDAEIDKSIWEVSKGKVTYDTFQGAICLRSGRDALKTIAREYAPTRVILPALACDSMVAPFITYGHKIKYYKLDSNYSINMQHLRTLIEDKKEKVLFLYMDYFGKKAVDDTVLEKLRSDFPNLIFIEDRTHNLLEIRKDKFIPEYIVGSIRKWINIPDGGLLWSNVKLNNSLFSEDVLFSETRLKAQCMRREFLDSGNIELKASYRKIFSTVSDIIDQDILPSRMSAYSYEILKQVDVSMIRGRRRNNAQILINELKKRKVKFIQCEAGKSDLYVAILVENRNQLQKRLAEVGIFCTIIWPLSVEQRSVSDIAKYTEEHMLAIYCDQRYTTEDMRYVVSRIMEFSDEEENNDIRC